ncbi:uncharacterized protein L3040_004940 [Drepanopeziza brunnea f. sp. 'multigermtubi']|uniref:Dol-P-Man:Man(5)GlcNAc(2)-PP-Dol alpha-1,3-mannosyltransferase n=1 Tax=Marssonina brunnea f. sp. multigermtubi (strain MB_m1) TaxID=1072389 RepID=K1XMH6_MARBU|nr:alpha-mannosyltransferase [Drepanopeziza brunnea f. sp. 'multigermtubi' MB_m1]EKD21718.1 alpha-mannosyltransferase [Drepanopeziza brunnea f. sp. 'multigermtubi' MB_m1]KAJ5042391.1 hypothetical protein L3040_004940 [Drepanopeziza brunnea f. sp. 'multigermtubi']
MAELKEHPIIQASYVRQARDIAMGVHPLSKNALSLLLLTDALLTSLIIWKVPYTEIDWSTYMQQVELYIKGERDYTKITGSTGPLVYPAAHVYIYWLLYEFTGKGSNILRAQVLFGGLYLATLGVVMSCYRRAKAPLYIFPMLILSKRLHSIFVLRLFNDCFAVFFLWVAIYFFQLRMWTLGGVAYSLGVGVKMSLLLSLPAVGVILFLARGFQGALKQASLMAQLQVVLALPFISGNTMGYLSRAFEFSRVFMFQWTVNWRFLGEKTFLSKKLAVALLAGHISTLLLFLYTRWLKPAEKSWMELINNALKLQEPCGRMQHAVSIRVSPNYVLTTILTANAIGMLFARSLHYQFYAYIALATPFLLWRSGMHPIFQYGLWAVQEWAWNVYPSTDLSSKSVVCILAITVLRMWWGTRTDFVVPRGDGAASKKLT